MSNDAIIDDMNSKPVDIVATLANGEPIETALEKDVELLRRLDVLDQFMSPFYVPRKRRRAQHYLRTEDFDKELKRRREERRNLLHNPNNRRSFRKGFVEIQYQCAVVGWLQLIHGKENVKLDTKETA